MLVGIINNIYIFKLIYFFNFFPQVFLHTFSFKFLSVIKKNYVQEFSQAQQDIYSESISSSN